MLLELAQYLAVRDQGLPLVRAEIEGILATHKLDAIVYPTSPRRPGWSPGRTSSPPRGSPATAP